MQVIPQAIDTYLDTGISEAGGKVTVCLDAVKWRAKVWINEIHTCG